MRKALYIMGILNDTDISWMSQNGKKEYVSSGSLLIREGQPIGSLFILLEGKLAVLNRDGREVDTMFSGEVFGEVSFVDSRPPMASIRASDNSHVLAIDAARLREKLEKDTGFASRFYRALATFLADRLRARAMFGSAKAREEDLGDPDELSPEMMESVSLASTRFDKMLKTLRAN